MNETGKWVAVVGGVVAVVGAWYGQAYYLSAIGGVIAIIGGFMK